MQLIRNYIPVAIFFLLCLTSLSAPGQMGFSFDIKKPEKYDDRVLGSEKSESKKFSLPRRFIQNTFTHYNYFFNANNKLNEVLSEAKAVHVDDYSQLLSFYNYSLDVTAENATMLDSVIYKSTTGIVLHDLRNDWIDNLYLLTGAAYYLRKQFDSAYMTFQFINYAFADKEKDGYYKTIGSRMDGNNALSISTKEKSSLPRKVFSESPSRNDAFIWQIRTLIAQEEYGEAASLIVTLNSDPVFPDRLRNDLEEVAAWWFYSNNMYDSAARHLSKALSNAPTKKERTRWEFLIAQLYELSGDKAGAEEYYEKVINHALDPVMEVHARLNSLRIVQANDSNSVNKSIMELQKMAKRDKYYDYRDIIYFTLAQMEMDRGNLEAVKKDIQKSIENNTGNIALKNKSWLQLAEINFAEKKYRIASNCYDSLDFSDETLKNKEELNQRKLLLRRIAIQIEIIERQDSLQKIAGLPEDERKDFVKKVVRQMRKQQGLGEESALVPFADQQQSKTDLFSTNQAKGEWYFYNASMRSRGVSDFKARWGNRPNVDNWRRAAGMKMPIANKINVIMDSTSNVDVSVAPTAPGELNYESLYDNLPLNEEKLKKSNDSIATALFSLGKLLTNELEDCNNSIRAFEELIKRFPDYPKMDEALFSLYYCYNKTGQAGNAAKVKRQMQDKHSSSPLTSIVTTGKDPRSDKNPDATKAYEKVYDLFIEGDFAQALAKKDAADSIYGSTYWTPQLLYIESVYYIKQRNDAKAAQTLQHIITSKPNTPMAAKAQNLLDVLSRRKQIEEELKNLQVERPPDDLVKKEDPLVKKTNFEKKSVDSTLKNQQTKIQTDVPEIRPDLVKKEDPAVSKTDVTITKSNPGNLKEQQTKVQAEVPKIRPPETAPVIVAPVIAKKDSIANKSAVTTFAYKPDDKHYAGVLLNKMDLVWVNETRNAFSIHNKSKYYNRQFEYIVVEINPEYRILLIGPFDNAQAASDYVKSVKPESPTTIIPWLKSDKYSFTIITSANLEILKIQKDINLYKQFVDKNFPGKF